MRAILILIYFVFISACFCQQTEQTFIVKKRAPGNKRDFPKVFDLKIGPVGDTICGGVMLDLTPAGGLFDSVSLFNLKRYEERLGPNGYFYGATNKTGHAIISLYKKQKDGTSKLIYFRNWVIHCMDRYSK